MIEFFDKYGALLAQGTIDTLVMSIASCVFAYVIGLPLGIWFAVTTPNGLRPNKAVNTVLGWIINIGRSIPFIILLVAIIPFTRLVVGTSLGVPGAVVPLTVAAAPFVARIVEQSLAEVDKDLIEAAHSFGASNMQIIMKVLLVEARTSLMTGFTITTGLLLGYSAMSGTVGGGGLGDIAVRYGYYRWQTDIMISTVILLIVIFQSIQNLGTNISMRFDKRKH